MRNNLFKIESTSAFSRSFVLYVDRLGLREFEATHNMSLYTVTQQ